MKPSDLECSLDSFLTGLKLCQNMLETERIFGLCAFLTNIFLPVAANNVDFPLLVLQFAFSACPSSDFNLNGIKSSV